MGDSEPIGEISTYLRNNPPLKSGDQIAFKFKGDFEYGKTYMVCADDLPGNASTGDLLEVVEFTV